MKKSRFPILLAAAVVLSQLSSILVSAAELNYSGIAQAVPSEQQVLIDMEKIDLVVGEVKVAAGDYVEAGDPVFILTDESYAQALAYYSAMMIQAENSLTDIQLNYDNGIMIAQNTYDIALANAENAEFVQEYQTKEVSTALENHEKMLTELEKKIEDLKAGNYRSSTSGISGGNSSNGSSARSQTSETEPEVKKESEKEPAKRETETERETEAETVTDRECEPETEGTTEVVTEPETEGNDGGMESETEQETNLELEAIRSEILEKEASISELEETVKTALAEALSHISTQEEDVPENYTTYSMQLDNLITQLEADIEYQKAAQEGMDFESTTATVLENSILGDEAVKDSLTDIRTRLEKHQETVSFILQFFQIDMETTRVLLDSDTIQSITEYMTLENELNVLYSSALEWYDTKLEESKARIDELENARESEKNKETENVKETEKTKETERIKETEKTKETEKAKDAGNGNPSKNEQTQSSEQERSKSSGSGSNGGNSGSNDNSSGEKEQGGVQGGKTGQNGSSVAALDGTSLSILKNEYNLSSAETLLAKEAADSEAAMILISNLEEEKQVVQDQYQKLLRNKKVYDLQIQYTYESMCLSERLALCTYQETVRTWEEKLQAAKDVISGLKDQQEYLLQMGDGVICAEESGMILEVYYGAGETLSNDNPLFTWTGSDKILISLEVPQEEITEFAVGDHVQVSAGGRRTYEGIIRSKAMEPSENTSRTKIYYTVTVLVDNAEGRIRAGSSANVVINTDTSGGEDE